jgi:hypothetical protein
MQRTVPHRSQTLAVGRVSANCYRTQLRASTTTACRASGLAEAALTRSSSASLLAA